MYSQDLLFQLIGLIYDAALEPAVWRHFLERLAEAVGGHSLNLAYIDGTDGCLTFMATARCDPAFVIDYERYYSRLDPWVAAAQSRGLMQHGIVGLGESLVGSVALEKTEFYSDFARRFQFIGGISAFVDVGHATAALSVCQCRFGQFGDPEVELIRALLPHLQRAMQVYRRLAGVEAKASYTSSALDHVRHGVLVISQGGKLLTANRAAAEIIRSRDGLFLDRGELRACRPDETLQLRRAISAALHAPDRIGARISTTAMLSRPSGRRPLTIMVAPIPPRASLFGINPAAVTFVTDPEGMPLPQIDAIRTILHLTSAEARLVQCLVAGHSVEAAAERLDIGLETARKRLKMIFQKTDTHRQADLVRLVLLSTPPTS
jgi:DNA-binding CsgD family transcriptional regulator/PAS domain-containing protein